MKALLSKPNHRYTFSLVRAMLALTIIPNLPFWIASTYFPFVPRFNIDFLFIAFLTCFCPRWVTGALLTIDVVAEIIVVWLSIYFIGNDEVILVSRFIHNLAWSRIAVATILVLTASIAIAMIAVVAAGSDWKNRRRTSAWFIGTAVLLGACLLYTDSEGVWKRDSRLVHQFVTSELIHYVRSVVLLKSTGVDSRFSGSKVESATGDFLNHEPSWDAPDTQPHNLVLVIVESYGELLDQSMGAKLTAPFRDPALLQKYDIRYSTIPFFGGTVSAEFREMCGLQLPISALLAVQKYSQQCLPDRLARSGYSSTGLHGYSRLMFDRIDWWRSIGFGREEFYEDLRTRPDVHICTGPFPGICDADMVPVIRDLLVYGDKTRPQFIYWLTLSSHLPIVISSYSSASFGCDTKTAQVADSSICNWMGVIYKANKVIADLAKDPALPPTDFILVGDHAPPFIAPRRRAFFSYSVVPSITLRAKP